MKRRVLIADDDPDILDLVSASMRQAGADVMSVTSGAELLERLAEDGAFDLVISDVAMPWMTGVEVARSLRAAGLEVPVILMTAFRTAALAEEIRSLGGRTALLPKPFDPDELDAAIELLFSDASQTSLEPTQVPRPLPRAAGDR